jgi:glycosyltransferase involved in cell wall biosynthesis
MTILWLNSKQWKEGGPVIHGCLQNAYALTRLGIASHLVVGAGRESSTEDDLIDYYGIEPTLQLGIHRVAPRKLRGGKLSPRPVFQYAYNLARTLAHKSHVVVVSNDPDFLPLLARLCRQKRLYGYYEIDDYRARSSWRDTRTWQNRRHQILEKLLLRSIDGIICMTGEIHTLYNRAFPRVRKISLPAGTCLYPDKDLESVRQKKALCFVDHSETGAPAGLGHELAAQLSSTDLQLHCLISHPRALETWKQKFSGQMHEKISLQLSASPQEHNRYIRENASIGLALMEETFYNRHLNCAYPVLDYLSHGVPTIASDLPTHRELLGSCGIFLKPGSTEGLISQVNRLLDDSSTYREAVESTRKRCRQLTWGTRALKMAEFFKTSHHLIPEVVAGKGRFVRSGP